METRKVYDITIIGGGPVGLFTAFYAGMRQAKVKIIESLEELGGQPLHFYPEKFIYDIPGQPAISGSQLTQQLIQQLDRFDTTFCLGEEALDLHLPETQDTDHPIRITTQKGEHYTRALIIAAGNGAFQPRKLNIEGIQDFEETNLHYYVTNIEQFRDRRVAILGGGDSALDWALTLEPLAQEVTLIHRRKKFRALEHSVQLLEESQVQVLTPYRVEAFTNHGDKIQTLHLSKRRSDQGLDLEVDDIIVNYGFTSSMGQLIHWGLETKGHSILTNHQAQTNLPGVYAVGDIADYEGKVKIIATGFGEGPTAVNHALAYIDPDHQAPIMHSTSLFEELDRE